MSSSKLDSDEELQKFFDGINTSADEEEVQRITAELNRILDRQMGITPDDGKLHKLNKEPAVGRREENVLGASNCGKDVDENEFVNFEQPGSQGFAVPNLETTSKACYGPQQYDSSVCSEEGSKSLALSRSKNLPHNLINTSGSQGYAAPNSDIPDKECNQYGPSQQTDSLVGIEEESCSKDLPHNLFHTSAVSLEGTSQSVSSVPSTSCEEEKFYEIVNQDGTRYFVPAYLIPALLPAVPAPSPAHNENQNNQEEPETLITSDAVNGTTASVLPVGNQFSFPPNIPVLVHENGAPGDSSLQTENEDTEDQICFLKSPSGKRKNVEEQKGKAKKKKCSDSGDRKKSEANRQKDVRLKKGTWDAQMKAGSSHLQVALKKLVEENAELKKNLHLSEIELSVKGAEKAVSANEKAGKRIKMTLLYNLVTELESKNEEKNFVMKSLMKEKQQYDAEICRLLNILLYQNASASEKQHDETAHLSSDVNNAKEDHLNQPVYLQDPNMDKTIARLNNQVERLIADGTKKDSQIQDLKFAIAEKTAKIKYLEEEKKKRENAQTPS